MSTEVTITYQAEQHYYSCYDDGGIGHDIGNHVQLVRLDAEDDTAARLAADDLNASLRERGKNCYDQPGPPWVGGIVKTIHEVTADGFSRTTTERLTMPSRGRCPCGKTYVPLRGEEACHQLVPSRSSGTEGDGS